MTTILHMGVIDIFYSDETGVTTGDVATILEARYHPYEIFAQEHGDKIAEALAESIVGSLESAMMGAPRDADPFAEGCSKIDQMFKDFLTNGELEALGYKGIPTQAALDGVNHRLKIKRGERRPSLIDTGLYQASTKTWVDGEQYLYPTLFEQYGQGFSGMEAY